MGRRVGEVSGKSWDLVGMDAGISLLPMNATTARRGTSER